MTIFFSKKKWDGLINIEKRMGMDG